MVARNHAHKDCEPAVQPRKRRVLARDASQMAREDPHAFALRLLALLGREDHPDAASNPIYALYQVAVDYRCSARGYRDLAIHRARE